MFKLNDKLKENIKRVEKTQNDYYQKSKNEKLLIDPKKYVVLDVETNGISSAKFDLLSLSIYMPDNKKSYNRYFPLELNDKIYTTKINGIKKRDLKNANHLNQHEFDNLIEEFELDKRIILHYGNIDEFFLKNYLKRKKIKGYEKLNLYNFKKDIISESFTRIKLSKDNLCNAFKIKGVKNVHSGINDCILEWKLFCKLNGRKIFQNGSTIYWYSNNYITPASYIQRYNNLRHIIKFPKLSVKWKKVNSFSFNKTTRFEENISGLTIENLIYHSLEVNKEINQKDLEFLFQNKSKLEKIFEMHCEDGFIEIPIYFENSIVRRSLPEFKNLIKQVNNSILEIKKSFNFSKCIEYIRKDIFLNNNIKCQELIVNNDDNVLSICDLSSKDAILEIKTSNPLLDFETEKKYFEKLKYQLFYESNKRKIFVMTIEYASDETIINFWHVMINIEK